MKLKRGDWTARNHAELSGLLAGVRPGEIAVLDWDNTCIFGDVGEALLRRMTFGLEFRMDARALAASVPDRINGVDRVSFKDRSRSLKAVKQAVFSAFGRLKRGQAPGTGRRDEDFRVFTSGLLALNRALEETPGIGCAFAYPWVNTLLRGLTPREFAEMADQVIAGALAERLRRRAAGDPRRRWHYDWTEGLRLYPEMRDLAARWRERGGRVVVSTASNRRLVERMIALTGFPPCEVIGMELASAGGRFAGRLRPGLRPNLGPGKAANLRSRLRREPAFVAGDSRNDYEMLTAFPSTRLRLVVDRGADGKIASLVRRARAGEPGWLAQAIDPRRGRFKADGEGVRDPRQA